MIRDVRAKFVPLFDEEPDDSSVAKCSFFFSSITKEKRLLLLFFIFVFFLLFNKRERLGFRSLDDIGAIGWRFERILRHERVAMVMIF